MKNLCLILIFIAMTSVSASEESILSRSKMLSRNLTGVSTAGHTCTTAITRFKSGLAANYSAIIGSGNAYTDASFTGLASVTWSDYTNP